jgi:hypothetical protein
VRSSAITSKIIFVQFPILHIIKQQDQIQILKPCTGTLFPTDTIHPYYFTLLLAVPAAEVLAASCALVLPPLYWRHWSCWRGQTTVAPAKGQTLDPAVDRQNGQDILLSLQMKSGAQRLLRWCFRTAQVRR